jgi:3-hydroxyacyl-CoA dehydrogenase
MSGTPAKDTEKKILDKDSQSRITLIGTGTIGLSFAAFHLAHLAHLAHPSQLTIYDTRPDVAEYVCAELPKYFPTQNESSPPAPDFSAINIATTLPAAVQNATIVQESGPENAPFKTNLWAEVERYAPKDALFWSSTSGIPASQQSSKMTDPSRVLVVHPYNPPHIMPLLELVPSPSTAPEVIQRTKLFWEERGRTPIVLKKEVTGFVANRLAFALLREAIHLVDQGVVSVPELDEIVQSSMGPRWAVAGPFKSYHAGGGAGGLEAFFENIGGTVQGCWDELGTPSVGDGWEEKIFQEAKEAYGKVDTGERDRVTRRVLQVLEEERGVKE